MSLLLTLTVGNISLSRSENIAIPPREIISRALWGAYRSELCEAVSPVGESDILPLCSDEILFCYINGDIDV